MKIPIVSVVGKTNCGKTTLIEKLVGEMKRRGYRVATIKHDVHGFDMDRPGKDTWRHARAGADTVLIVSSRKLAMIKQWEEERSLEEIAGWLLGDVDLVITEGFKSRDKPKIEVVRRALGNELLCTTEELLAIVSDIKFDMNVPRLDLENAAGLADLIERTFSLKSPAAE